MPPRSPVDPTTRFSDRVADYVRCRPAYPDALVTVLEREGGLPQGAVVADVGAGTGISSDLFLRHGYTVIGVEPNPEMRAAAEELLRDRPRFRSAAGRAEATGLPEASVDLVAAGQAFHWFEVEAAHREFARILRPGGLVALFWNSRRTDSSPFLRAYEALLQRYGTDYGEVSSRYADPGAMRTLFGGPFHSRSFVTEQLFDFEGLRGRLLSSSYAPTRDDPRFEPMLRELKRIFAEHQEADRVRLEYDTEVYFGPLVAGG